MLRRKFKDLSFFLSFVMATSFIPTNMIVHADSNISTSIEWNFNDQNEKLGSWKEGGSWDYNGQPVKVSYDNEIGDGALRLDVDYSKNIATSWSEVKVQNDFSEPKNFNGYNELTYDFIYDPSKMTTGAFKTKLFIADVADVYTDINLENSEDIGNGLKKAKVKVEFASTAKDVSSVIIGIIGSNTDYSGAIYIDNINFTKKQEVSLPTVNKIVWSFADQDKGIESWKHGGNWAYNGKDVTVSYDNEIGEGSLKLDVDYSKDVANSWSEVKLQNDFSEPKNFNGYNQLTYDFIYDSTKLTTGTFKTKLFIADVADVYTDINLDNSEDIGNGLKKATVKLEFASKNKEVSSVILGIIGSSTDYSGPIYIDNISFGQTEVEDVYVEKTSKPTAQTAIDVSSLEVDSQIKLVDKNSSVDTSKLYAYLKAVGKEDKTLYGHQNDTHHKAVLKDSGTNSDTKDLTGSLAAIVGIDTLSLTGAELQLTDEDKTNNITLVEKAAKLGIDAANEGSIITMSAHMPNFALVAEKGKDANGNYDYSGYTPGVTTGDVVSRIMPGGDLNEVYNGYLDMIAEYANILDEEGVPVLFRPFHENNGSWFWWGKAFCDEEAYKNMFRYTVEYLRDTKNVHNFLYVYSPNGPFQNEEDYLSRYPGDEFIDIIAFDMYHDNPVENAEEDPWLDSFKETIDLVQGIADKKGKLSAVSETGIRKNYGCMPISGNPNKNWFSDVSNIVAESNMPYYMVWANFDENNIFAPYMVDENKGHEMINSFIDFYNEESSVFADGVGNYKEVSTTVGDEYSYGYITSPASRSRILEATKITARIKGLTGSVKFILKDNLGNEIETLDASLNEGIYEANITKELLNSIGEKTGTIELNVDGKAVNTIKAIFNIKEEENPKELVDSFETYYGESVLLENKWATNVGPGCSLTPELTSEEGKFYDGEYGLKFNYKVSTEKTSEGWAGMTRGIGQDWSEYDALQLWVYPDGNAQKLVIQVTTNGEDFEVFLPDFAGTTEPKLLTLKFSDFKGKNGGTIDLSNVERFGIWCNTIVPKDHVGKWTVESTMYFDGIKAINTKAQETPSNPSEPSNPGTETPSNPGAGSDSNNSGDGSIEDEEIVTPDKEEDKNNNLDNKEDEKLPNTGGVSPIIPLSIGGVLIFIGEILRRKRN